MIKPTINYSMYNLHIIFECLVEFYIKGTLNLETPSISLVLHLCTDLLVYYWTFKFVRALINTTAISVE